MNNYDNYNVPLQIGIEEGQLVIRVGIDVISFAFEASEFNNRYSDKLLDIEKKYQITDSKQFTKDVITEIAKENEKGSSVLTDMLDKACIDALQNGSLAVRDLLEEK